MEHIQKVIDKERAYRMLLAILDAVVLIKISRDSNIGMILLVSTHPVVFLIHRCQVLNGYVLVRRSAISSHPLAVDKYIASSKGCKIGSI